MDIYNGLEVAAIMKPNDKAVCIEGSYVRKVIEKSQYGDIYWLKGEMVGLDRWFIEAKWMIQNTK